MSKEHNDQSLGRANVSDSKKEADEATQGLAKTHEQATDAYTEGTIERQLEKSSTSNRKRK